MRPQPAFRILVVDDDPSILDYMKTLLKQDGLEVDTCAQPTDVVARVKEGFHLVVLDLMMPGMDGVEVLREIRRVDDDVSVAIYTGYPSLDTAVETMKLDAVDYLQKPFKPEAFREVIDRVMKKKGFLRSPEETLHRAIGETVRGFRKEQSLTLKQMARRTGLSVSLLSQIERAESSASISSLYKIASALDVRIQQLFGDF